jgi:hypothetical protein
MCSFLQSGLNAIIFIPSGIAPRGQCYQREFSLPPV